MSEEIYDREIAPVLLELARKCEEHGLSLVAMVEFAPNETGTTMIISEGAGIEVRLTAMAARALGNFDALYIAAKRHAEKHGNNSIALRLGEPHRAAGE